MLKSARILLTTLLLLAVLVMPALAAEEEDRYFPLSQASPDTFSNYFLDMKTLRHVAADRNSNFEKNPEQIASDKGYIQAWVKVEYVKSGAKEVVESLKMQERNVTGYEKLAFSLQLLRVKPSTQEVALLVQADYDKNGKLLGRNEYPADRWVPYSIEPRTKQICEGLIGAVKAHYGTGSK